MSFVSNLPEFVTIREGEDASFQLEFNIINFGSVNYQYSVSANGGTASQNDIGSSSGSEAFSIASSSPTIRYQPISISAFRDDVSELTETAFLRVQLSGNMRFADGSSLQVVRIDILDDNQTIGGSGDDTLRGRCCTSLWFEDSLGESSGLDGCDEQAAPSPLPYHELAPVQPCA